MKKKPATRRLRKPNLRALAKYWQRVMRLQDWAIVIAYARYSEMGDGVCGDVRFSERNKTATIRILDPVDMTGEASPAWKVEKTVVHELAHLYFVPLAIPASSPLDVIEDQAVESIARGFMAVRHGKERR